MSVCIIVQARMASTRLPGKVMKKILNRPMLDLQLERLHRIPEVHRIIVATTNTQKDQTIVDLIRQRGREEIFRGSEENVLDRYYQAALRFGADPVVRVTADCPLIDPEISGKCIRLFLENRKSVDFVSNCEKRMFPRGLDTEVLSFKALAAARKEAVEQLDKEHVTRFIRQRPERFQQLELMDKEDHSDLRLTVDTAEDFELVTKVYEFLYRKNPDFDYADILKAFEDHPEWKKINAQVKQKII